MLYRQGPRALMSIEAAAMLLLVSIATYPRHQPSPDVVLGSAAGSTVDVRRSGFMRLARVAR